MGARRFAAAAVAAVLLYLFQWLANKDQTTSLDVVIYGATPSGIAAALAVMDTWADARVAILEPANSIGGMATQGIGLRDFKYVELMRSTMREWSILNAQFYNVTYPVWQPDNFVGEASFKTLLGSRGIHVYLNTRLEQKFSAIRKTPHNRRLIAAIKTYCQGSSQSRWWTAKYFVDASYEGDLLRFSGASYTLEREANSTYNESRAGVTMSSLGDFDVDVDPIGVNGELLPFVNGFGPSGDPGSSDKGLMGYSMRVCVTTNLQKRVPFSRPPEYSARTYELLARYYRAGGNATPYLAYPYVSYPERDKFDVCDNGQHKEYVAGMFWFLQTDPSVPKKIQHRN
ncbi:NADFAD-dependent dehydrogenase, putative [Hondaea fermentalgiana]|uniref:NADFAD-dependent dehydrogenase, putative n=1 Tax=Hondaea fermentalgiana TaxID=2315210 RepID=A0A2R5GS18_9STRA|nr:NADFAD-dependent dehydrogenase, putative [Hondaea fermentalgiana]|eukprot:GBG33099.1 NADFAD-dependent dehydrogenase, putative [Hondaea fermentalgiana]